MLISGQGQEERSGPAAPHLLSKGSLLKGAEITETMAALERILQDAGNGLGSRPQ